MTVKIGFRSFFIVSLVYLALPVLVMVFGLLRLHWALVFACIAAVSLFCAIRSVTSGESDRFIELKIKDIVIISVIAFVWVFFSGVSEFSWTTADHPYRYAILKDLIDHRWPVAYDLSSYAVSSESGKSSALFVYYFPFWSIPALFGKVFGLTFARILLFIQSVSGIMILCTGLFFIAGKKNYSYIVALLLFSTFDFIPFTVLDMFTEFTRGWESWGQWLGIHSDCFQMMNVFNQCIPGWIVCVLFMQRKSLRYAGILGGLLFCYSPWAVIGMFAFVVYEFIVSKEKKTALSFPNLVFPIVALVFLAPYYTMGHMGNNGFLFRQYDTFSGYLIELAAFIIFEFGLWIIILWPRKRIKDPVFNTETKKRLLILIPVVLTGLSVYKMGGAADDLLLRGSMIPEFILMLMFGEKISVCVEECKKDRTVTLPSAGFILISFISALTPVMLMFASILGTCQMYTENGWFNNPDNELIGSFGYAEGEFFENNELYYPISYDYQDSFFFRYLARK